MAHDHGKKPSGGKFARVARTIATILIVLALVLILVRAGCSDSKDEPHEARATSRASSATGKNDGPAPAATVTRTYQVRIPDGGVVHVPEKNADGTFSTPVHIPSGYTICRDADRGRGSYQTQYLNPSQSDEWKLATGSGTWSDERYQSNGPAQNLRYSFVPESATC